MELFNILSPIITFIGAGVVWWLRGRKPAAVNGFAGIAKKILEVVDGLDDEDDVKHEFTSDLFKLLREYTTTETPAVDVKAEIKAAVASMADDVVRRTFAMIMAAESAKASQVPPSVPAT